MEGNDFMNRIRKSRRKLTKREILFAECDGICPVCGRKMSLKNPKAINSYMTIDHVRPKSKGGCSAIWNEVAMCRSCNNKKGCRLNPDDFDLEYELRKLRVY